MVLDRDYRIDQYAAFKRMYPILNALLQARTQDDHESYRCVFRSVRGNEDVNLPKSVWLV